MLCISSQSVSTVEEYHRRTTIRHPYTDKGSEVADTRSARPSKRSVAPPAFIPGSCMHCTAFEQALKRTEHEHGFNELERAAVATWTFNKHAHATCCA